VTRTRGAPRPRPQWDAGRRRDVEALDERLRLEAYEDLAGSRRGGVDLRLRWIQHDHHVDPAEGLVPGEAEVAPGTEGLAVEGQSIGRTPFEGSEAGTERRTVRLEGGAVHAARVELRQIRANGVSVAIPQGRPRGVGQVVGRRVQHDRTP
jgi:hypothetical protein